MTAPLVERLQAAYDHPSHFSDSQHAELHAEAARTIARLQRYLVDASNAFDDCTGEYPQELVLGEGWRTAAHDLGAGE